jgi:hypothetical protein
MRKIISRIAAGPLLSPPPLAGGSDVAVYSSERQWLPS